MNKARNWMAIGLGIALFASAIEAEAASVRVRCEKRSNRSRVSVDGAGLARGSYRAVAVSGTNKAKSGLQAAVGGEVEFDFDSNANDIAEGAVAISPTFIQNGSVTGKLVNTSGVVVAKATVACEVR